MMAAFNKLPNFSLLYVSNAILPHVRYIPSSIARYSSCLVDLEMFLLIIINISQQAANQCFEKRFSNCGVVAISEQR